MNGYNYDYMSYINNIPNNIIPNPNYLMNSIPNNMDFNYITQNNNNILDPYEGLIRGNLFNNLYDPYKDYKAKKLNPTSEKDALLEQWQQYNFALIDLNLYLDTNPNDRNALALYGEYLNTKKQLQDKYETKYGPIELSSNSVINGNWKWINSPWPWEVDN